MNSFKRLVFPAAFAAAAVAAVTAAQAQYPTGSKNAYTFDVLVSDQPGAPVTDKNLKNPWGVAFAPGDPFWIADNNSGKATVVDGNGAVQSLVVTIPCPKKAGEGSSCPKIASPTGIVFNTTTDFVVPGTKSPAFFIFDSEDGTISAWNESAGTSAVLIIDNSRIPNAPLGAVYKGLALGVNKSGNLLFATNFRAATVEVYDGNFKPTTTTGGFKDPAIPAGYAPFGIHNLDGDLIVTYALQDRSKHDNLAGPGRGYVDAFDTDGNLLKRLATQGGLNAPWGVARASSAFGLFAGDMLVGNFGNGWINALTPKGLVLLNGTNGQPLEIDGLWTLTLGGAAKSSPSTLYFTAGPNNQMNGRFGTIAPAQ
jgi:uncharacterized protein (TIGR03118 family)